MPRWLWLLLMPSIWSLSSSVRGRNLRNWPLWTLFRGEEREKDTLLRDVVWGEPLRGGGWEPEQSAEVRAFREAVPSLGADSLGSGRALLTQMGAPVRPSPT